jgi:hypothetical protein
VDVPEGIFVVSVYAGFAFANWLLKERSPVWPKLLGNRMEVIV